MNEGGENHISNEPVTLLQPNDVPIGAPLEWPIFDTCGVLLFDRGATLSQAEDRTFLFQHFQPQRGDLDANEIPSLSNEDLDNQQEPLTVNDLDLTIGMSLGIRAMAGKGGPMHASKLIGLAQNDALFIMAPVQRGQPLFFVQGEQIEVVAVSVRAVFFFLCTVDTVCSGPFNYLILSAPFAIRRLRSRKSARARVKLAVSYAIATTASEYEGIGIAQDISPLGMSLAASIALGTTGDRLHVRFRIKTGEFNLDIDAMAYIRNVRKDESFDGLIVHGIEFDQLESEQRIALKCFIFDQS